MGKILFFVLALFLMFVFENEVIRRGRFVPAEKITKKQILRDAVVLVLFNVVRTGTTVIFVNFIIDIVAFVCAVIAFVILVRDIWVYYKATKTAKRKERRNRRRR